MKVSLESQQLTIKYLSTAGVEVGVGVRVGVLVGVLVGVRVGVGVGDVGVSVQQSAQVSNTLALQVGADSHWSGTTPSTK